VLLQGFSCGFLLVGVVFISNGIGDVSADFGHARATGTSRIRAPQEV
jgi:hypothetical protein